MLLTGRIRRFPSASLSRVSRRVAHGRGEDGCQRGGIGDLDRGRRFGDFRVAQGIDPILEG